MYLAIDHVQVYKQTQCNCNHIQVQYKIISFLIAQKFNGRKQLYHEKDRYIITKSQAFRVHNYIMDEKIKNKKPLFHIKRRQFRAIQKFMKILQKKTQQCIQLQTLMSEIYINFQKKIKFYNLFDKISKNAQTVILIYSFWLRDRKFNLPFQPSQNRKTDPRFRKTRN